MTFTHITDIATHINRYHRSFAGHTISRPRTNIWAFDQLARMEAFANSHPAFRGATFEAVLFDGATTEITIERDADGWRYSERIA